MKATERWDNQHDSIPIDMTRFLHDPRCVTPEMFRRNNQMSEKAMAILKYFGTGDGFCFGVI
jgi:hypothetical protein